VREAMQWIAASEDSRGWYAAPVGWFDNAGDGHFAVAIRSALFTGNDALVYAGAGIVADSDPQLEYQETGLKQRAILDALGILG
jgi:isochorismate synthase EntC